MLTDIKQTENPDKAKETSISPTKKPIDKKRSEKDIKQTDKPEKPEKTDKADKADKVDKVDKADKTDKPDKVDKVDKTDKADTSNFVSIKKLQLKKKNKHPKQLKRLLLRNTRKNLQILMRYINSSYHKEALNLANNLKKKDDEPKPPEMKESSEIKPVEKDSKKNLTASDSSIPGNFLTLCF